MAGRANPVAFGGLAALTLIWSYSWIVMKSVTPYMGAFDFAAARSLLGALLLFVVLRVRGRGMKPPPFWPTLTIGLLQTGGMTGFSQWALVSGGAGKVAILTYTMPFWVILLAALFLNERMRRMQYLAIVIAAAGLILVLQPWRMSGSWQSPLLAILSGVSWGASAVLAKRVYARYPSVDLLSLTTWQMAAGALVLCVVALLVPQQPVVWHPYVFMALTYNAVLATALGWVLWLYVLKNLPAGVAGLCTLAVPVCGVLLSWWLLGENPGAVEGSGITLIVLALVVLSQGGRQKASVQRV